MQQDDWDDLRYVLALGRNRSVAKAAAKLGVNQTTVTRRLVQCEDRFGTRIFQRTRGAVTLTDAGASLMAYAERVEREVLAARSKFAGLDQKVEGTVRFTSVPILINQIFVPALPRLLEVHPALQLELVAEPRELSLTKRETDLAVRLSRPSREAPVLAQKIGELRYGIYGPPAGSAGSSRWIVYDDTMAHLPHAKWLAARSSDQLAPVAVNDAETALACIQNGIGKSLLPVAIAETTPGLARYETPTPAPPSREIWLLNHPDHKNLVRIKVASEWAKTTIRHTLGRD
ncbi:MAG: LysR family transcriptional regulator [Pseudomonadota bacterium]